MEFREGLRNIISKYPSVLTSKNTFDQTLKECFPKEKYYNLAVCMYDRLNDICDADSINDDLRKYLENYLISDCMFQPEASKEVVDIFLDVYGKGYLQKEVAIEKIQENEEISDDDIEEWDDFRKYEYFNKEYNAGRFKHALRLAECYEKGIGTEQDEKKALEIHAAIVCFNKNRTSAKKLADAFSAGEILRKNNVLKMEFDELADPNDNNTVFSIAGQALQKEVLENIDERSKRIEYEHFNVVEETLSSEIQEEINKLSHFDEDLSWMDYDQKQRVAEKRNNNRNVNKLIEELSDIRNRPYYARMDLNPLGLSDDDISQVYIGERMHMDYKNPEYSIVSVWSKVGALYRESNKYDCDMDGEKYEITLRRRFAIEDAILSDIRDEYVKGDANRDIREVAITDPFLKKILASKKKEREITNIIRSIQYKQNQIIEEDAKCDIVVQGCAGSGKTMILLHRLANLKYHDWEITQDINSNLGFQNEKGDKEKSIFDNWKDVKIITPNDEFASYIDDLAKNLDIDSIKKCSLETYLINLLEDYVDRYSGKNKEAMKNWRKTIETSVAESNNMEENSKVAQYMYTDEFLTNYMKLLKKIDTSIRVGILRTNEKGSDYVKAENAFVKMLSELLRLSNINANTIPHGKIYLLSELLFMKVMFGPNMEDRLLCIDEAQDIPDSCFKMLKLLSDDKCVFNVYGDLSQRIDDKRTLSSWNLFIDGYGARKYELKENYRNGTQIVDFYNNVLDMNDIGFGIDTKDVEKIDSSEIEFWMHIYLALGYRVAYITRNPNEVYNRFPKIVSRDIKKGKVNALTPKEAKGLEYDTVFVNDDGLSRNEKYIAYTRALSNMYLV